MKNLLTLFLLIPFLLHSQDGYNITSRKSSSTGQTLKIFSSGNEQIQLLRLTRYDDLVLCSDNLLQGKEHCAYISGYNQIIEDEIVPLRFVSTKEKRHFLLAYTKRKDEKELFKIEYDLVNNKLLTPESIGIFDEYKNGINIHSTLAVLASENNDYFAIVEMMGKASPLEENIVRIKKLLLDSQLEKIYLHQSSLEGYYFYEPGALTKKSFSQALWSYGKAILSNQGDFYFLQKRNSRFGLISVSSSTHKAKVQHIEGAEFNELMPTINHQSKIGVEFWSVRKEKDENDFEIKVHSSQNGDDLKERTLRIPQSLVSNFEVNEDDTFILINSITTTLLGKTYLSLSPTKNNPLSIFVQKSFKINGLSILEVEGESLIPLYQTRYSTRFKNKESFSIGTIPFAWDAECNNRILFFYADSKAKDYMYKSTFFEVNAIELNCLTGIVKPLSFEVPNKSRKVTGIYPKIYVNGKREFVVLELGDKWSLKTFLLITPKNIQKVYKM